MGISPCIRRREQRCTDYVKTEKYFVDGYVCRLKALNPLLNTDVDIYELNKMVRLLATLNDFELKKLSAVMGNEHTI